ncbi:hypothetical protein [Moraxella porci]|uniref:hypothetical protein n=1 Tax=Moraxella porci TaxID=1288392 RepID=UPI0024492515|nr:hypothetical protein [Moraxella porci]MDH2274561.1 hypothetical protein [Moraxella porci]
MYKSRFKFFVLILIILIVGLYVWYSHNQEVEIYRAQYLEEIFPGSKSHKTFIIKSNYFNKPSCSYLENWAKTHIKIDSGNDDENYTFLKYSENITTKNKYLNKEYDAIIGDYWVCEMSTTEYVCFICHDEI